MAPRLASTSPSMAIGQLYYLTLPRAEGIQFNRYSTTRKSRVGRCYPAFRNIRVYVGARHSIDSDPASPERFSA